MAKEQEQLRIAASEITQQSLLAEWAEDGEVVLGWEYFRSWGLKAHYSDFLVGYSREFFKEP